MGIDQVAARAVFLDRDGVINRAILRDGKPYPPGGIESVEVLPGVSEALRRLKLAGYLLVVVTNQPDVAKGTQSRAAVERINDWLTSVLPIDEVRTCYHDDDDDCACRKPKAGLILDAARAHGIDLMASVVVGDRWRDVGAGKQAGCATVFIDRGYAEQRPEAPDAVFRSLPEATDWILSRLEASRHAAH